MKRFEVPKTIGVMNDVVDFYCPAYQLAIEIHVAYRGRLARSSAAAGSAALHGLMELQKFTATMLEQY